MKLPLGTERYYCERGTALSAKVPLVGRDKNHKSWFIEMNDTMLILDYETYATEVDNENIVLINKILVLWHIKKLIIDLKYNMYQYDSKPCLFMQDYFNLIRSTKQ